MGYKGNNDRGKGKNRTCGKAYWCSRQKITKQKWAKTDAMTSAFAHYHQEIIHFKRLQNFRKCIFFCSKHYICSKFVNKHHFLNKKFGCLENVH